ncbi:MAG: hypothetical protein NTY61_02380, partial [Candidatus Parcubacteria bacterium]|nr:hypothetical protein [Candidatus Parcubacteria bacterium]
YGKTDPTTAEMAGISKTREEINGGGGSSSETSPSPKTTERPGAEKPLSQKPAEKKSGEKKSAATAEDQKNQEESPEAEKLKEARKLAGFAWGILEERNAVKRGLHLSQLSLGNDLEKWQEVAKKLDDIRKDYVKDRRLGHEKNPMFQQKVADVFIELAEKWGVLLNVEKTTVKPRQESQPTNNDREQKDNSQENREKELILEILKEGGIGIHTSLPREYHPHKSAGFIDLVDNRLNPSTAGNSLGGDVRNSFRFSDFDSYEQQHRLEKEGVNELVTFEPAVRDVIKEVDVPVKKERLGGLLGSKTVMEKKNQKVGEEAIKHSEVVKDGKDEPLVKLKYQAESASSDSEDGYYDYSGRRGNVLEVEICLPKSTADKVSQQIKKDPKFIRQIIGEAVVKGLKIPAKAWQEGDEHTNDRPVRPPYEKWDAKFGGKIYVKEAADGDKFNTERIAKL